MRPLDLCLGLGKLTVSERVQLRKTSAAVIRVRLVPWRMRPRRVSSSLLRENASNILDFGDDVASLFVSIGMWLAIIVAAPVITFLLAVVLLPFEAGLVAMLALALLAVRFAGVVPWTVVLIDNSGAEKIETYRSIARALRRVRSVNGSPRRAVQLVWA